ncbi:hypothetical protein EWE75_19405 [Sphingomonas populi]|uniref:Uncharacterized protein n=1 Tax=Sphingomonas populi TaxID=2484750 RepID=A0A4Q6XMG5_9SPHN|nr:hypothetical protein [Sphingomonas populi]RZF61091.1 hypothetical protein EWE75_19405 [Sphingomonas populi]
MQKIFTAAALGIALAAGSLALPGDADARTRAHNISVQGAQGRGYVRQHSVTRQPGYRSASRSLQTNDGRGVTSSRAAGWADGSYSAGAMHTTNTGTSWGRSTSVTKHGDGSYSGSVVRTHADGSTSSRSKTVTRD